MEDLTEAYLSIYENHDDLNEVKGFGGHVDPNTGKSSGLRSPSQQAHATHWRNRQQGKDVPDPRRSKFKYGGSKGSTTGAHEGDHPEDFAKKQDPDLAMTPAKRMETRATALRARGQRKRANKIDAVRNRPDMKEDYNAYDLVLTHLLDEGYCDSQDSAIKMMAAMSQDWIDAIVEEFVDPEHGETPSGRTPLENVADHPKKSVRKKAVAGFKKQMGKEYGGNWKSKSNDAR